MDRYDRDVEMRKIQSSIADQVFHRQTEERERQFDAEFSEAVGSVKTSKGKQIFPADAPARKDFHDMLWNITAQDPRNRFVPKQESMKQYELQTNDIVNEYWEVVNNLIEHEVGLRLGTIKATAGKSMSSPHKGGAPSMAATAGGAEGRVSRPTMRPLKEGESAAKNIMASLASGVRAPKQ
jgi:hypothetical protein